MSQKTLALLTMVLVAVVAGVTYLAAEFLPDAFDKDLYWFFVILLGFCSAVIFWIVVVSAAVSFSLATRFWPVVCS